MRIVAVIAALMLSAQVAQAVSVSNLDDRTHYVVFEETHGSKHIRRVDPGETMHSVAGVGSVYLRDKPQQRLMIEELDRLAIWPEGKLQIQMRRKRSASQ